MILLTFILPSVVSAPFLEPLSESARSQARTWVDAMSKDRRGPYEGVMWFCEDGTILPPKSYACAERGGGDQYGVLNRKAKKLAKLGIHVGTVLTSLSVEDLTDDALYRARAYIIESFLERALGGWVLASAKSYRGFRQIEDEEESARTLMIPILRKRENFDTKRSLMLRLIRALPYGRQGSSADEIRALAGVLGDADPAFADLRFKIHALPEPSDIDDVVDYAESTPTATWAEQARVLAKRMTDYYNPAQRLERLTEVRGWVRDKTVKEKISVFAGIDASESLRLIDEGARLMEAAENALSPGSSYVQGERNLLLLHVMELVEQLWIGVTADLSRREITRNEALSLLVTLVESARRLGYLSSLEQESAVAAIERMRTAQATEYAEGLEQAFRVLEWARARVRADVDHALTRYAEIEPRAVGVVDDILRGGVMLPLAKVLDRLAADVEKLRGGGHRVLGVPGLKAAALRGENAGLATGVLRVIGVGESTEDLRRDDIAVLRGLPPELPPVAGIITLGRAGMLSHISVLARNLAIPHASIDTTVAERLLARAGERFVLGVSSDRRVALGPLESFPDSLQRELSQDQKVEDEPFLKIDASRLSLSDTRFRLLSELSDDASGKISGPKAAELGRLKRLFPDRVSEAVVIPFGVFVSHVDRAGRDGSPSPLSRLRYFFRLTRGLKPERAERVMLAELERFRRAVAELPFPDGFSGRVEAGLRKLGAPGTFGVFVRSDTNVEDLPQFSGAGLNKTVPHRVGLKSVLAAIRKVWGSPYTERSYRWRQRVLANPEYVFPSVILHRTVPAEKSGVLVTSDLDTGDREAITVSAGEGVAAVVDGGFPQTVVLGEGGWSRLVASCRATLRKEIPPPPREGVVMRIARGLDPLLNASELGELKRLAREVEERFPRRGSKAPWDIEFGLLKGHAWLMQIRPLNVSKIGATHPFLLKLDREAKLAATTLSLDHEVPQ
ncbi:MAG: PEP/pyruvate-binding domain-containing protein [Myxococcota bacterium]